MLNTKFYAMFQCFMYRFYRDMSLKIIKNKKIFLMSGIILAQITVISFQAKSQVSVLHFNGNNLHAGHLKFLKNFDFGGKPITGYNNYENFEGSPFEPEKFSPAILVLNNDTSNLLYVDQARIDLLTNALHFLNQDNFDLVPSVLVNTVVFVDNGTDLNPKQIFKLVQLFETNETLYLKTYNSGKYELMERINVRTVDHVNDPLKGQIPAHFKKSATFYIFNGKSARKLPFFNEASVSDIIPSNDKTALWLKEHKNKLNKKQAIIQYIDFYNATMNP
ncbi:MAG: hypothetical protein QM539_03835 [Alphaproteobacteria bacterium]|nr:hypothetical protein [Alphaproteobacteria bacterium]